jgi:hypothetical protein
VDKEMIRMGMKRSKEEEAQIKKDNEDSFDRLMKRAKTVDLYANKDFAKEEAEFEAKAEARARLRRYRQFNKTDDDEEDTEVFQTNAAPSAAGTSPSPTVVGSAAAAGK